jgi:hypothetical protein
MACNQLVYLSSKCSLYSFICHIYLPRSDTLGLLILILEKDSELLNITFYFTGFIWIKHKTQMRSPVFWNVVPWQCVADAWCFETAVITLLGDKMSKKSWTFLPFKTRPIHSLKITGSNYPVSWCHMPEEWRHQLQCWKSVKIHIRHRESVCVISCVILNSKFPEHDLHF